MSNLPPGGPRFFVRRAIRRRLLIALKEELVERGASKEMIAVVDKKLLDEGIVDVEPRSHGANESALDTLNRSGLRPREGEE